MDDSKANTSAAYRAKNLSDFEETLLGVKGKQPQDTPLIYSAKSSIKKASCFSRFLFLWSYPYIKRARFGENMSLDDFGGLRESDQIQVKLSHFLRLYEGMPKKNLLRCIGKAFKWEYLFTFVTCMFGSVF